MKNLAVTARSLLTDSAKMSNSTDCNPYTSTSFPFDHSCVATTGPFSPKYNLTNINQTGQSAMNALKSCCPSPANITIYPEGCYSYCKTTGREQALETTWCLGNYTILYPDDFFGGLGCDTRSGATMLGRTSVWGGLVTLSLVVSAAATML